MLFVRPDCCEIGFNILILLLVFIVNELYYESTCFSNYAIHSCTGQTVPHMGVQSGLRMDFS